MADNMEPLSGYRAYNAAKDFLADGLNGLTGVPLIQQLNHGLVIMSRYGASLNEMEAFCLRPMFQSDAALATVGMKLILDPGNNGWLTNELSMLVMEYRNQRNRWGPSKVTLEEAPTFLLEPGCMPDAEMVVVCEGAPTAGPLPGVRMMLIGSLVQEHKDFLRHQADLHPRIQKMSAYFGRWFKVLGISKATYDRLVEGL